MDENFAPMPYEYVNQNLYSVLSRHIHRGFILIYPFLMTLVGARAGVGVVFRWSFDSRSDFVTAGVDSVGLFSAHPARRPRLPKEVIVKFIHLQVHNYSEALPTHHGYCVGVSCRSATGNCVTASEGL